MTHVASASHRLIEFPPCPAGTRIVGIARCRRTGQRVFGACTKASGRNGCELAPTPLLPLLFWSSCDASPGWTQFRLGRMAGELPSHNYLRPVHTILWLSWAMHRIPCALALAPAAAQTHRRLAQVCREVKGYDLTRIDGWVVSWKRFM